MRISDWSSDVCSSDLRSWWRGTGPHPPHLTARAPPPCCAWSPSPVGGGSLRPPSQRPPRIFRGPAFGLAVDPRLAAALREVADARHVIGALLDADHAARREQVEKMARLAPRVLGGQRTPGRHPPRAPA